MFDLTKDLHDLPSRTQPADRRNVRGTDPAPSPDMRPAWDIPEPLALTAAVSGRVSREEINGPEHSCPSAFESLARTTADPPSWMPSARRRNRDLPADCDVLRGESFHDNAYP